MPSTAEAFAKYQEEHPGEPVEAQPVEAPVAVPAAEPTPQPAAAETPEEKRVRLSLDEILPDDPRLPASMRGKPISALVDYNHEKDIAAQRAGAERNEFKEKYEATKTALEILSRSVPTVPRETSPSPKQKVSQKMRSGGTAPEMVFTDVNAAFDAAGQAAADLAREEIVPEVSKRIETQDQRIARLEAESRNNALRSAFLAARPEGVSLEDWNSDAPVISSYIVGNSKDPFDPESYREAGNWLEAARTRKSAPSGNGNGNGKSVAPPAPQAPAPPVGNGSAAPPQRKASAKVPAAVRGAFDDVAEVLRSVTKSKATTDSILEKMRESGRYKGMFE